MLATAWHDHFALSILIAIALVAVPAFLQWRTLLFRKYSATPEFIFVERQAGMAMAIVVLMVFTTSSSLLPDDGKIPITIACVAGLLIVIPALCTSFFKKGAARVETAD
jgi:ABC-type Fe3+-siderophore transport system permease subunit